MLTLTCFSIYAESMVYARLHALIEKGVHIIVETVSIINARFLRQNPKVALILDEHGVWLAANGMKMQPAWGDEIQRLKRATVKNELLARACHLAGHLTTTSAEPPPSVIDCTAGLGHDALLLAYLGARVTLVERHPVLWFLLVQQIEQAQNESLLASTVARMNLVYADAADYLVNMPSNGGDIIYLDPMFVRVEGQTDNQDGSSKKKKTPQVKKPMQILHQLFALKDKNEMSFANDLGDELLPLAQSKARRVIVKRSRLALFLANQPPDHQWIGDACRFDGYFTK